MVEVIATAGSKVYKNEAAEVEKRKNKKEETLFYGFTH